MCVICSFAVNGNLSLETVIAIQWLYTLAFRWKRFDRPIPFHLAILLGDLVHVLYFYHHHHFGPLKVIFRVNSIKINFNRMLKSGVTNMAMAYACARHSVFSLSLFLSV